VALFLLFDLVCVYSSFYLWFRNIAHAWLYLTGSRLWKLFATHGHVFLFGEETAKAVMPDSSLPSPDTVISGCVHNLTGVMTTN
jgi:hypothetical protein